MPAEREPLPDERFDLAISEHSAFIWADPAAWIPEAARMLMPGGRLVFLRNTTLSVLCSPDEGKIQSTLQRPQHWLGRIAWPDGSGVEFHPSTGELIRRLRVVGFEVLDLIELYAPGDAIDHPFYDYVPAAWAKEWPAEEICVCRKAQ